MEEEEEEWVTNTINIDWSRLIQQLFGAVFQSMFSSSSFVLFCI